MIGGRSNNSTLSLVQSSAGSDGGYSSSSGTTGFGQRPSFRRHSSSSSEATSRALPLRDAALVKAVRVGFDEMRPADVVTKLKPLAVPGNAWFGVAGELVAVAHFKAGKPELAKPILIAMVKDEGLSPSLRSRAAQLALAAGVDIATLGLNARPAQ